MVSRELADRYSEYTVRQVVEFTNEFETSYMVNAYNNKETVVLKLFPNGDSQRIKNQE